jgi:hypothetical protein
MQARSFFGSLFDYSFSSFITPRIIKVLYILMTILVALWTLAFVLFAFKASTAFGILTLIILGPLFFVLGMIYVRVGLEVIMAFFNIHGDVSDINRRGGGSSPGWSPVGPTPEPAPATAGGPTLTATAPDPPVPPSPPPAAASACANCGAAREPGKRFCTSCGQPFD